MKKTAENLKSSMKKYKNEERISSFAFSPADSKST
jgi:hypothetical protein